MRIYDVRQISDASQQLTLSKKLQVDKIDAALVQTCIFLGRYSGNKPQDFSIQLVDGKIGEGTINGNVIEIQLPSRRQAISEVRALIEPLLKNYGDEEKDKVAEELVMAATASTVLHEGVHGLLDSRPGSAFFVDFEAITGFPNKQGETSTLLDEGIAYAVQGIYAPNVELIGNVAPIVKETDERLVKWRKKLGEKLRPDVKEYMESKKSINTAFFEKAKQFIVEIQKENSENCEA